ncbi:hypothetical protein ACO0LG_10040 [Undibacterium sp. Ji42W]|uniref:hypothetical protein n=1 Tax=Undibacterium sp. Ji42W TaxID=3413039 RepID=UPI003BF337A0
MKRGNGFTSMHNIYRYLVLALLGATMLSACDVHVKAGYFDKDKAQALASVDKLRTLYEKQDYARLYDMGSTAMKASVQKEQFATTVQTSLAKYGKYKSSVLIGSSCFPNEVRLVYNTEYENMKVMELMVWSLSNSDAGLVMYQISPGQSEFQKQSQVGCPTP